MKSVPNRPRQVLGAVSAGRGALCGTQADAGEQGGLDDFRHDAALRQVAVITQAASVARKRTSRVRRPQDPVRKDRTLEA